MRTIDTARTVEREPGRPLISWGAIFGGAILGLALLALMSSLWFALGFGSEVNEVRENLEWFVGVSAVVCLFVAGIITGYLAGVRSAAAGLLNALALWAVLLVLTLSVGIPAVLNVFSLGRVATEVDQATSDSLISAGADAAMWASFWTILGAALAAGLGGMLGGAMIRGGRSTDRTVVTVPEERIDRDGDVRHPEEEPAGRHMV
jgi:hypothetical protein